MSKALDLSSATARVAPDLIKDLAIPSEATVGRSSVDSEDIKPKKGDISLGAQQSYYLKVFQNFSNHRKKTNRVVVFSCRTFPNLSKFLNTVITN